MKKRGKTAVLALCAVALTCLGVVLWAADAAKKQCAALTYQDVDMALVADGTYYGEADAGLVFVQVAVLVRNHIIEDVRIVEHENGFGSAAEAIVQTMVEKNNYAVDAISGATLSSEAIKSAVSNALMAGQTK